MTGQIRKTAAKDALKQLQDECLLLTGEVQMRYKLGITHKIFFVYGGHQ